MRTVNATFSLPVGLYEVLQSFVEKRGLSRFVTNALEKALQDQKVSLRQAYIQNSKDDLMNAEMKDWDCIESEGWPHE